MKILCLIIFSILYSSCSIQNNTQQYIYNSVTETDIIESGIEYYTNYSIGESEIIIDANKRMKHDHYCDLSDIVVDEHGNIYILDHIDIKVHVYNENGKYIMSWGSDGYGPADLGGSKNINITDASELIIGGLPLTRRYTNNGILIESWKTIPDGTEQQIHISRDMDIIMLDNINNYIISSTTRTQDILMSYIVCINVDTDEVIMICDNVYNGTHYIRRDFGANSIGAMIPWVPMISCASTKSGKIVWGDGSIMGINVYNPESSLSNVYSLNVNPINITNQEMNTYIEVMANMYPTEEQKNRMMRLLNNKEQYPSHKPFYDKIISWYDEYVWLRTPFRHYQTIYDEINIPYYIFMSSGEYIGIIMAPARVAFISRDAIYNIIVDKETGYQELCRHSIIKLDN